MRDKSVDEQIRFASEYLAARSRSAGSLRGGLAGYGEGSSYADKVLSRIPGGLDTGGNMPAGASLASAPKDGRLRAEVVVTVVDQNGKPRSDVTATMRNVTYSGDPAGSAPA